MPCAATRAAGVEPTAREILLRLWEKCADWSRAADSCRQYWPAPSKGRRPADVAVLLRLEFIRKAFGVPSTMALIELARDSEAVRLFLDVDPIDGQRLPGRATIDRFRKRLDDAGQLSPLLIGLRCEMTAKGLTFEDGALSDPRLTGVPPGCDGSGLL